MAWLLKVAIFATFRFNNHVQIDLVDLIVKGGILATFNNHAQIYLSSTKDLACNKELGRNNIGNKFQVFRKPRFDEK